jgi:FKBP-type peptidyl-prolyl cis-trans isomerase (trigger factor)
MKYHKVIKITRLPQSEVEIEGEITAEQLENKWEHVLEHAVEHAEIDGFRKGKAPKDIVLREISESELLYRAAEEALGDAYPLILSEEKLDALGSPAISITKIARKNPLGFKIRTALFPEIRLADYKTIAKKEVKEESISVSEKEVKDVIAEVRKNRAKTDKVEDIPELTDESVKEFGDFKNIVDFKEKVKEGLTLDKKTRAEEKKRWEMIDAIVTESKIDLPEVVITEELRKMEAEFTGDLTRAGMTYEKYLAEIKKTDEDVKKEWRGAAEKRSKTQLILSEIGRIEKLDPDKDEVEKEVSHVLAHYKDANPDGVRTYIETTLRNKKVLEFLEGTTKKVK